MTAPGSIFASDEIMTGTAAVGAPAGPSGTATTATLIDSDVTERDAVAVGQLGAEHRLIQTTGCALVVLQHAGIEREPATVVGLHLGQDHQVRVPLRIVETQGGLPERVDRQALAVGCRRPPLERLRVVEPNCSR